MIDKFKKQFPSISNATLDVLLSKGYYRYNEVAHPVYVDGDYYYYQVDSGMYKVNLITLHRLGILPNGQYIVGATGESENVKLLEGVLAGKEEVDQRVIGINIPVQPQTAIGPLRSAPTYGEGDRRTITYFGQVYHGQVRNGELYLDEYCQMKFIEQLQIIVRPRQKTKLKELSVSELMREAHGYKTGYKPYDPSKPLPTATDTQLLAINSSGLGKQPDITKNILLSSFAINDDTTVLRFVSSLEPGKVSMTDYILTTKTVDEWMATVKRGHSLVTGVTDALEIASGVGDVTILIPVPPNGAQVPVTIPFSMIGNAAQAINLVAAQNPPKSIRYIETAVGDKLKIEEIMLPDRIIGYEAKFDEHGNLTIIFSREYRFTQRQW